MVINSKIRLGKLGEMLKMIKKVQGFVLKVMNADEQNIRTVYDSNDRISTPYFKSGIVHPDGSGRIDLSEEGGCTDMAEYLPSFSGDEDYIAFSARYGILECG